MAWLSSGQTEDLGVVLCHIFSVDDVLKFSLLSVMPNFMTLIVLEEHYRVCRLKALSSRREKKG